MRAFCFHIASQIRVNIRITWRSCVTADWWAAPTLRFSVSVDLGWDPKICIPNKILGYTNGAGLGTPFRNHGPRSIPNIRPMVLNLGCIRITRGVLKTQVLGPHPHTGLGYDWTKGFGLQWFKAHLENLMN